MVEMHLDTAPTQGAGTGNVLARKKSIATLQFLRGIAAVAVAFYHVYIILMDPEYGANVIFQPLARFGFLGVSFFFVLSGFIIFMAHRKDVGRPGAISIYAYKRLSRVFPAYWVYLSLFILASAAGIGHPEFSWDIGNLISSYLLVPLVPDITLPLKVAWTLVYEIRFYVFFLLLLVLGMRALWAFVAWSVVILGCYFLGLEDNIPSVLSLWNVYFLIGMLGFLIIERIPTELGIWILGIGIALFITYTIVGSDVVRIANLSDRPGLHLLLAPAFLGIILGGVLVERAYELRYPSFFLFLGDASYSIYLVHSAVISAVVLIGKKLDLIEVIGLRPFFIMAFIIAVAGGITSYILIEKPLIRLFRFILNSRT